MQTFNWIEISDLHYGLRDQGPLWPNVREVFFDDLTKLSEKTGPWNAVIFTGDLTQQGAQEEFASLDSEVFEPLWRTLERLGSKQVTLITVPGNHDLVRPDTRKPSAAVRQLLRQNSFYEIEDEFWSDGTCEYRAVVDKAFANYVSWIENSSFCSTQSMQRGILPGDFSLTLTLTENGGTVPLEIGIVGINTAFLQLAGGDYKGRLVWDIKQIHGACGNDLPKWVGRHMACVLLTHHGPDWLDTRSRDVVYPEINPAGRFAVHMFGHMHENIERATSLGGGPPLRQWQAASLFGMEQFGEPPTLDRRHGYSVGRLAYSEGELTIRHWPRVAVRDANGWRFERDAKNTVLDETDGGTTWEKVLSRATKHHRSTASLCERQEKSTVLGRKRAQTSNFGWPHDQPQLRAYCEGVSKAHSHIRFVEIPYLKDLSDIELDSLYVEPRLSSNEIHPDMLLHKWPRTLQPIEALRQHPRLVLLGDPGSGKSTLISCLSWQLCRPRPLTPNAWAQEFGGFLPLPMILRELRLKSDLTWEGLLDAFLQHRIGMLLVNRENIEKLLAEGRAMVLLDGLDEIGNISIRKKLRDAVHIGMANYPSSRWLLTSRVVGYEQVPFHTKIEIISGLSKTTAEMLGATNRKKRIRTPMADILFLAPFNDEQIRSFATNWYAQHEKDKQIVDVQAEEFVTAIRENEGTQRLGRIPYLLTLMALIHHKNSRLPHGRTELYERIAAAYLESIDLRRRLDQLPYSLAQKKRWLAAVAYRMQLYRARKDSASAQSDIVINKTQVQQWLREAMMESGANDSRQESEALLKYFAQRSGLLLPRGEGRFAF
ncbi:MAG TPA: metallophosphoesterase, partial [Candidatus Angelobacter sp.]|nr:metallophosphoesterase [Candidatus Angelobacter sp.]